MQMASTQHPKMARAGAGAIVGTQTQATSAHTTSALTTRNIHATVLFMAPIIRLFTFLAGDTGSRAASRALSGSCQAPCSGSRCAISVVACRLKMGSESLSNIAFSIPFFIVLMLS